MKNLFGRLKNSTLITIITLSILYLMGRIVFCKQADLYLWTSESNGMHTSQHLVDPYSFTHFEHGIIFFILLSLVGFARLDLAALIEAAWEILENSSFIINRYRSATIARDYTGDSIVNSFGDILCCLFGFYIANKIPVKSSLLILFFTEIILLLTIRDNLLINIIMLIHPIEAIKAWQSM